MKALSCFTHFDLSAFLKDKVLAVKRVKSWTDYKTGEVLGTSIELIVMSDETEYPVPASVEGGEITNVGETFTVKVRGSDASMFSRFVPMATIVEVVECERSSVWGEYRNNLTVVGKVKEIK